MHMFAVFVLCLSTEIASPALVREKWGALLFVHLSSFHRLRRVRRFCTRSCSATIGTIHVSIRITNGGDKTHILFGCVCVNSSVFFEHIAHINCMYAILLKTHTHRIRYPDVHHHHQRSSSPSKSSRRCRLSSVGIRAILYFRRTIADGDGKMRRRQASEIAIDVKSRIFRKHIITSE